ncbi:MAG: SDR family oxidoreductase [Rhodospirillaceae bacterium]|mgnify:CR=1 FL=1|nr:SDR family oxidoreductase [Rhodospirillaceae bacterium]MBT5564255.1 SDR family oxidoreductase [Rhodospirillaceae bacterium]MBT6088820.1 SDR family oxidoreductase [Rhodospirillaceae bacterium]MBT7449349.1 SDR family oxidoreductase [Rhodospirillaceae bacterium]
MSEYWVFGGSKPLGVALREALSADSKVVSFSRSKADLEGDNHESVTIDFSNTAQLREVIRNRLPSEGPLGVVFCQRYRNEGGEGELESIKAGLDVELAPVITLLEEFDALKNGPLSIVLISSVAGRFSHNDIPVWYHVLKSAALTATKVLANRNAASGTRVNCVVLGEFEKYPRDSYTDQEQKKFSELANFTLGKRICSKVDITNLITFLLSDQAEYVSGQTITLDGTLSDLSQESIIRSVAAEHSA